MHCKALLWTGFCWKKNNKPMLLLLLLLPLLLLLRESHMPSGNTATPLPPLPLPTGTTASSSDINERKPKPYSVTELSQVAKHSNKTPAKNAFWPQPKLPS
jgi:hypothetical protein